MAVPYEELPGSPVEDWELAGRGLNVTMRVRVHWQNRHMFVQEWMGKPYPRTLWGGVVARCYRVGCQPFDGRQYAALYGFEPKHADYDAALITLHFGDWGPESDQQLFSENIEPTTEFITLPVQDEEDNYLFRWGPLATDRVLAEGGNPSKLFIGLDYMVTYYHVTSLPSGIFTLPGHVNNGAVTAPILGRTFDAETLLFKPPAIHRMITTAGARAWNIPYRFSYKPNGHNQFWNPETGQWSSVYHNHGPNEGAIYRSYPVGNFALLWP